VYSLYALQFFILKNVINQFLILVSFIKRLDKNKPSLPLEGKVGGGLRRSDEVAKFYRIYLVKSDLTFSASSVAYAPASPQGEALIFIV